jgi:hypothetical protein
MKIDVNYYKRQDYYDTDYEKPVDELRRYVDVRNHYDDKVIVSMRLGDNGFWYCVNWIEDSVGTLIFAMKHDGEWDELDDTVKELLLRAYEDIYQKTFEEADGDFFLHE